MTTYREIVCQNCGGAKAFEKTPSTMRFSILRELQLSATHYKRLLSDCR